MKLQQNVLMIVRVGNWEREPRKKVVTECVNDSKSREVSKGAQELGENGNVQRMLQVGPSNLQ